MPVEGSTRIPLIPPWLAELLLGARTPVVAGTGTLSILLAEEGYQLRGLDLAPNMVAAARDKARSLGSTATFEQGDASTPPFLPSSCDVVLCRHVLWALPDPAAALRRWIDLLRPGGRLLLIEGSWSTGGGLRAQECERLLHAQGRSAVVQHLDPPAYWSRTIEDERYLVLSLGPAGDDRRCDEAASTSP